MSSHSHFLQVLAETVYEGTFGNLAGDIYILNSGTVRHHQLLETGT